MQQGRVFSLAYEVGELLFEVLFSTSALRSRFTCSLSIASD